MKHLHAFTALAAVVMLGAVASACGGAPASVTSSAPAVTASTFSVAHYTNDEHGFAIDYPEGFAKLEMPADGADPKAPLFDVFFADPEGAQISGKTVDTLEVAVYGMSAAPTEADFDENKADFEAMLAVLVGELPDLKVVEPIAWITVDGRPAVTQTYTYTISGHDVAASAELVFKAEKAYLVRAQAARETWATTGRQLISSMATLTFL